MLSQQIGILCLSEKPDDILMFSHYAKHHTGICLKFEATDDTEFFGAAQQVNYRSEYPVVDFLYYPERRTSRFDFFDQV